MQHFLKQHWIWKRIIWLWPIVVASEKFSVNTYIRVVVITRGRTKSFFLLLDWVLLLLFRENFIQLTLWTLGVSQLRIFVKFQGILWEDSSKLSVLLGNWFCRNVKEARASRNSWEAREMGDCALVSGAQTFWPVWDVRLEVVLVGKIVSFICLIRRDGLAWELTSLTVANITKREKVRHSFWRKC